MKTFKQHVKEGMSPLGVGVSTSNSPEDGSIGVHNIHVPEVLQRVNAFVGSIAERENINRIGLTCSDVTLEGEKGNVNCEVKQFGGRFGKDTDGSDINDYGISHKKEGGLKLNVEYETLKNGTSKVYAKLV